MSGVAINYTAPPTIGRFFESNARRRVIVGPLGSGKSSGCVMEILRRACEQRPSPDGIRRTRFAVIRNTRPQLNDTTRKTFEQWIPDSLGEWNETDFTFHMRFKDVDCEVLFRALDKPKDVRRALSLEITGAYINEAREIPKEIWDGIGGRCGRYPKKDMGGATWFGLWADTNPWHTGHWGYELFSKNRPLNHDLFEQPSGRSPEAENTENLPDNYYDELCLGKDAEWILEYVDGKYPSADKGSVYGELIARLEERGGICDFDHPKDGVFVNFDLGVSDSTAMWFWRIGPNRAPDIIDWYEASGQGASHYFEVMDSRGYRIDKIWLPHDARQRTFQTGVTTIDQFIKRYGQSKVAIGPEVDIENGLMAGRWLLEQPIRIHARCGEGVRRLRAYRYAWDETKKVFSKKPLHDWTSHTADGWRYTALVVQATERLTRPPEKQPEKPAARSPSSFTLDEIWPTAPRRSGRI